MFWVNTLKILENKNIIGTSFLHPEWKCEKLVNQKLQPISDFPF